MVTLPQLENYSQADHQYMSGLSPLFDHYKGIIKKEACSFDQELRQERHGYWLQAAYATFLNKASTETICHFWSLRANELLKKSWQYCQLDKYEVALFAFGKLGSMELNLSSDIDVVFVRAKKEQNPELNKALRQWIQLLSQNNEYSFVFRVDTNLRPGGETSPLCPDVDQFIHYYGYLGEAWNRISFVRQKGLLGNKQIIDEVESFCQSYSYPRRLDYSILNSIKNLRHQIKKEKLNFKDNLNIKFAPGGIRDIELYLQSLQVIYGGRKQELRQPSMSQTIENLTRLDIISKEEGKFFQNFYWLLRSIENCIQGFSDQHSYNLNAQIWPLLKEIDKEDLRKSFLKSEEYISSFFVEPDLDKNKLQDQIKKNQLSPQSEKAIQDILNLKSPSSKKANVEQQKRELVYTFLEWTEKISLDKDLAIQSLKDFIFSIKSKSSIFYMLNKKPHLLEHLVWLFSFSPYIGQILCSRPELLDSFVLGNVEIQDSNKDIDLLLEDLVDYKLLTQMSASSHFLKSQQVWPFCTQLSTNTDLIAKTLLKHLQQKWQSEKVDIVKLGKWGGGELGLHSDLDFVFVTEEQPKKNEMQVARRFINLVSSPSRGGKLFNIDLRLKPNEQAGPLIVSKDQLKHFILSSSEAWQKQAYLKSHLLMADQNYYSSLEESFKISEEDRQGLHEILQKLLKKNTAQWIDIKYSPGGLIHTEFCLQIELLKRGKIPTGSSTHCLFKDLSSLPEQIWGNYSFLRRFEQLYGLCTDRPSPRVAKDHPSLNRLQRVLELENPYAALEKTLGEQTHLLNSLDASH